MVYDGLSLFMSMSNLILININIMDMKKHKLIWLFKSMLVGRRRSKIVIRIKGSYYERK
jgi:hypothetical protein